MQIGSFELQVMVSDHPVREFAHQGRVYIEGRKGSRFTLKFRNSTVQRVLAVPSIDGLSAIDGQPATGNSKGYIVPGYSATEIKGWRTNLREAADFVFTDRATSYGAQTAGAQNCGVIAVKVFAEKFVPSLTITTIATPAPVPMVIPTVVEYHHHHHHWPQPYWPQWQPPEFICTSGRAASFSGPAPSFTCDAGAVNTGLGSPGVETKIIDASQVAVNLVSTGDTPNFVLGTGFGQVREDVVSETGFERGLELVTFEIFYSDEASLTSAGVPLTKAAQVSKPVPQAFGGFCRPPAVTV